MEYNQDTELASDGGGEGKTMVPRVFYPGLDGEALRDGSGEGGVPVRFRRLLLTGHLAPRLYPTPLI